MLPEMAERPMPWAYSRPVLLSLRYKQTFSGSEHSPEILPDEKGDNFPCISNHGLFPSPYPSPLHSVSSGACFLHILITIITIASVPCFRHLMPSPDHFMSPSLQHRAVWAASVPGTDKKQRMCDLPTWLHCPSESSYPGKRLQSLNPSYPSYSASNPIFLLKQYFHWQEHFTATNVSSCQALATASPSIPSLGSKHFHLFSHILRGFLF